MKKNAAFSLTLLCIMFSFAQKKESIKGSKIITTKIREIANFNALEISDNLEVYLEKGTKCAIKIETDDNLQDVITTNMNGETLEIKTSKTITNAKSKAIWITYTADLKSILVKNEVVLNAINTIELNHISISSFDETKLLLNVNAKNFVLNTNDKTQTELNLKSDEASLSLANNSNLKALINSINLKLNLTQKSAAIIEGNMATTTIKLANNTSLDSRKMIVKLLDLTTESYSNCKVFATTGVIISAIGKSEVQLLGTPKIEIRNFLEPV